jgi:hypothetical protein
MTKQERNAKRRRDGGKWTQEAAFWARRALLPVTWPNIDSHQNAARIACMIVAAHSRRPSTRAEARRLLEILESKAVDEEFTPVAPDRAALEAPPTQWVYIDPRGRFGTQGH